MLYIIFMCISHFIYFFFANDLLLAVYFTLILNYEMMLDKKQIQVIFFNWSSERFAKQSRQLATSIMHLAQELLMNGQCIGGSRSFAKEMRTLKMRSVVAGHRKLTTTNWEQSLKLILQEKLPKNSMSTILWSFSIWSKLERWKKLDKVVPHDLTANQKNHCFEVSSSLILHNNNEPCLSRTASYVEKWILYDSRWQLAQWLNREEAPKHFPKPNLHPKNVVVTGWWSVACLIHCSFLNPSKTIISESMLSKLMIRTEDYSACSWHWSTERTQFFSTTTSNRMSHNQHFKSWMNWATKFCLICHIHLTTCQPTTTSSSNRTSWRQNASTTSRRQKMLSKSPLNPEALIFTLWE